jgi:mono/diheme cytochrome c family protein
MHKGLAVSIVVLALAACTQKAAAPPAEPVVAAQDKIAAGRYLVKIGGCNDCHTNGFPETGGNVPEENWLQGDAPGFNGPWGTSYPANLRLSVQAMSEDEWVGAMHTRKSLPPMPWPSLAAMNEQDLRAIYQFIHSLGPKGGASRVAQPPGELPKYPYYFFMPLMGKAPTNLAPPPPGMAPPPSATP